jgi:hypothetical protein
LSSISPFPSVDATTVVIITAIAINVINRIHHRRSITVVVGTTVFTIAVTNGTVPPSSSSQYRFSPTTIHRYRHNFIRHRRGHRRRRCLVAFLFFVAFLWCSTTPVVVTMSFSSQRLFFT